MIFTAFTYPHEVMKLEIVCEETRLLVWIGILMPVDAYILTKTITFTLHKNKE